MIIPDSQLDAAAQSVAQPDTDPLDRAASQVAGDQIVATIVPVAEARVLPEERP